MKVFYRDAGLVHAEDLLRGRIILSPTDIARGLAAHVRFSGQTTCEVPWTVLSHSFLVSELAKKLASDEMRFPGIDRLSFPESRRTFIQCCGLWGLLHDASEAIVSDVAKPFKHLPEFDGYRDVEANLLAAYRAHYVPWMQKSSIVPSDLSPLGQSVSQVVKIADAAALYIEAAEFLPAEAVDNVLDGLDAPQTVVKLSHGLLPLSSFYGNPEAFQEAVERLSGWIRESVKSTR
jgi:5'-deoxynucleotidase YfbR-like HD superfamily hydrolase